MHVITDYCWNDVDWCEQHGGLWSSVMREIVIGGADVSVQKEMNGPVWWVSFIPNVLADGSLYTQSLFPIFTHCMRFLISLLCSSRISPQLLRIFATSIPACTWRLGVSRTLFLFPVVNCLLAGVIVIVSFVLRLLQWKGRMLGISGVMWVQLTQ